MSRQLFQHDPRFGYRFIPGLKARVPHEGGGYLMRTNGAGFRCRHEFEPRRRPGLRRVLLFGDSYTAGDGVSDADRYGEQLERLVPGLEVYNFGLPGSGTDQQYLIYKEYEHLAHDVVLIGVLVENIKRVSARCRPYDSTEGERLYLAKPFFTLEAGGALELHQVPVPKRPIRDGNAGDRLARMRDVVKRLGPRAKDRIQRLTRFQPVREYRRPDSPKWRLLKAILLRWTREARAPVVIMPIPLYQHVERTASARDYRARFAELHDPPRVVVHDPLPDLWRHSPAERRGFRFERDCHLTAAAHRALAERLAPVLGGSR